MKPFMDQLARSLDLKRGIVALTARDVPGPAIVAVTDPSDSVLLNVPLRMGTWPGGAALQAAATVRSRAPDGSLWLEIPLKHAESIAGVICLQEPAVGSGRFSDAFISLAEWAAILVEESLALRIRIEASTGSENREDRTVSHRVQRNGDTGFSGIIGRSAPMMEAYSLVEKVAPTESTVLVTGESGTGKELVARAIHDKSRRSSGPFVAVNCAALPESVVESELFGHEKGSFTGAHVQRKGRFELASGGTLFLDEIGELSLSVQAKLLRILQERSFERVGGSQTINADVRIVVATNRDLEKEVSEGRFREDLYFRFNVFPIHMPPLRERGSDILLLADHFADKLGKKAGKPIVRISSPALDLLMIYHWPGNVRELENCFERAVIMSSDGVIHAYNLPPSLQSAESTGTGPSTTLDGALARLEKELVLEALKMERGNAAAAARRLAVTERRIGLSLRRFGIDWRRFRTKQ
jgi:Nif-specific regulatory protein